MSKTMRGVGLAICIGELALSIWFFASGHWAVGLLLLYVAADIGKDVWG